MLNHWSFSGDLAAKRVARNGSAGHGGGGDQGRQRAEARAGGAWRPWHRGGRGHRPGAAVAGGCTAAAGRGSEPRTRTAHGASVLCPRCRPDPRFRSSTEEAAWQRGHACSGPAWPQAAERAGVRPSRAAQTRGPAKVYCDQPPLYFFPGSAPASHIHDGLLQMDRK